MLILESGNGYDRREHRQYVYLPLDVTWSRLYCYLQAEEV